MTVVIQLATSALALAGTAMAIWYALAARRARIDTERQYQARLIALFATPRQPRPPSEALKAARDRWEGRTVVCRDRVDPWWGRGHRHRVQQVDEHSDGDIVVVLQCLDCPRGGGVGLVLMDGWEIVES